MNTERLAMRGVLAQKRLDLKKAQSSAEGNLIFVRTWLKPYVEIEELQLDLVRERFEALYADWEKIRALKEEIARLEAELNG